MKPKFRPYQTEDDFWRMREFLRQVFLLNDRREWSWHVARLDYARWHSCLNCAGVGLEQVAFLWEADGQIVAFLMPDGGRGEAHLCIHPALRTAELEAEMLATAEQRLFETLADESRRLMVWSPECDSVLNDLLVRGGYQKHDWTEHQWRRKLDGQSRMRRWPPATPSARWGMASSCWNAATPPDSGSTRAISA